MKGWREGRETGAGETQGHFLEVVLRAEYVMLGIWGAVEQKQTSWGPRVQSSHINLLSW